MVAWVNHDDHVRFESVQRGAGGRALMPRDVRAAVARVIRACDAVQRTLVADGADYMHNARLGWINTCPSNLGIGMRINVTMALPALSARSASP